MSRFADHTEVSAEKSRAEIETLLRRYGADHFASGWEGNQARVGFKVKNRFVRFTLILPVPTDKAYTHIKSRYGYETKRSEASALAACEQEVRRRWRALALVVKAKLEAVETGITTFDQEFMAHIVMPGGKTVAEMVMPGIEEAYKTGKAVPLLGGW